MYRLTLLVIISVQGASCLACGPTSTVGTSSLRSTKCSLFLHLIPGAPQREVYFMGLIDVLTQYDTKKKAAHAAKTVKHGVSSTSCKKVF